MSTLTAKQQSFIDMMNMNDELARKGFQLLLQRSDYPHFFDSFREAGFFDPASNPAPIAGEQENTVRIPYWSPLDYLREVAKYTGVQNNAPLATKVMELIRAVSSWRDEKGEPRRNYHTNHIFAEILGLLPTNVVTLNDIDLLGEWLNDPYDRMLVVAALSSGALPGFLSSVDPGDWKKAALILYRVTAIGWRNESAEGEPTPVSIVDDFWLGELLKKYAKQIGGRAGSFAAEIMLERVREVFATPTRRDHSNVFRPAVEDDEQNHMWRSVENRVVEGLRDVVLGWASDAPQSAHDVVARMLKDDLQIIRRVGIYVLGKKWTSMGDLYASIVESSFLKEGHLHELYHLLQDHFAEMNREQQAATVKAIDSLPTPEYGDDPERLLRHVQYRWLSAIQGKGYSLADERFRELTADPALGKLDAHPDFDSYITSWVGPGTSPYSPEELIALAKSGILVEKLNTFSPRDDWHEPTTSGLTSALETAARANPTVFLDSLSQHLSSKPIYQHALINGLKQAWDAKADVNWALGWEQLVRFFEELSNSQDFWGRTGEMHQHWVVSAIADFLHAGTKTDEHAYEPQLLPRTQLIIDTLLQREPAVSVPEDDAVFQAMNRPKGRIIEALFSQALRAARISDQKVGSHKEAWNAIAPIFQTELAKCTDANFEFSTFSGMYLPQLQFLDDGWSRERVDQIFPTRYELNTVCALGGLAYAAFTRPVYELLAAYGIVERALGLELKERSAREKLLERIGAAYLWGLEHLDGQCLKRVFDTTKTADLSVLARVFWAVRNQNVSSEQRERILAFWEHSLVWVQRQSLSASRLLSTLSLLATHIVTIGPRERRLLEGVAPYVHIGHESYEFLAELLRLAPQDPETIVKVLQSMISAHVPEYDYQDRLRSLLEILVKHGQREAVILMSDRLRHLQGAQAIFKNLTQR